MTAINARAALLPRGWAADVRLDFAADGTLATVEIGAAPAPGDERAAVALPGIPNLHSHAFQRAMAGLAEARGPSRDTFWSWREIMYRHALTMTPEQVEATAAQLYVEMLEAGFTRVGEFYYLHHDTDGRPYADVAEMAGRIAAAAHATGIGLTLLPVFYAHATFGGAAPTDGQRRFVSDLDGFARLLDGARAAVKTLDRAVVGVAPHSLRAVTPEELSAVVEMGAGGPIHIHVAEQVKEVEDCLTWSGARPVAWLLDHAPVNEDWCLIHATHMLSDETAAMARSGAVAGLCPITEGNLGDGIFDGPGFLGAGGRFGIGSDSNVLIGLADELRQLEYAQRLGTRSRNVMAPAGGSVGHALFDGALAGGAAALGASGAGLVAGAPADVVTLDVDRPAFWGRDGDAVLDAWIFACADRPVDGVWVGGRQVVSGGRHVARERVAAGFRTAMAELRGG